MIVQQRRRHRWLKLADDASPVQRHHPFWHCMHPFDRTFWYPYFYLGEMLTVRRAALPCAARRGASQQALAAQSDEAAK
jgi:hypothetical protein